MRFRTLPVATLLGWLVALSIPMDVSAQNFNPETGGRGIIGVTINTPGQGPSARGTQIVTLGVEECRDARETTDGTVGFTFQAAPNFVNRRALQYDDALALEFPSEDGFQGECRPGSTSDCRRFNSEESTIRLTPEPQEQILQREQIEIQIGFEEMLEYVDGTSEACEFAPTSESTSNSLTPLQADGGVPDGGTTEGPDAGNGGPSDGVRADGDRLYAARIFLTERMTNVGGVQEESRIADVAIELDLTRPPEVTDVRADATENKAQVKFELPSETDDIETFHVFHSTSPFRTPGNPEVEEDRDDVRRRLLTGASEDDEGTITADATGIDRDVGEDLYLAVATRDDAGNFSVLAERGPPVTVKSVRSFPYEGSETGGCSCSTAGRLPIGGLVLLTGLGALGLRLRRRAIANGGNNSNPAP